MRKAELTLSESWRVLGKDSSIVIMLLKNIPNVEDRVKASENALKNAQKIAQKLMIQFHPDRNPNNKDAEKRFKLVNKAIRSLEIHTETLRRSFEIQIEERAHRPNKDRVNFI